ncbi:MAG: thiamine phosphate synthase [Muribaculaceae bacterium]|nr:thiamine phosphate synthase [Muribaculaceae bacterium]
MLQFITHKSDRFSIAEEVKMVIDGGCRWVQLRMKDVSDEEVKSVAEQIIPMCQDTDTILVIDDRVELTMDLKVHGVHLGKNDMPAVDAREYLGAGAIIGVTANTAQDIIAYKKVDVDYVGLGPFRYTTTKSNLSPIIGLDGYRDIITEVRNAGVELPIVAIGGITLEDVAELMSTGVNGVAMSGAILSAENPTEYTKRVIEALNKR